MSSEASTSRVLRLHVWGAHATLPTLDPTSLYAASLLQCTFRNDGATSLQLTSATTSTPRVPLLQIIQDGQTVRLIDDVNDILSFCVESGLDAHPTSSSSSLESASASDKEQAAKTLALHAMLDDQLLDLVLHSLFSFPANFRAVTVPSYSSTGPWSSSSLRASKIPFVGSSIPSRLRFAVEARLTAIGLWGLGGKEATAHNKEADDLAGRAGIITPKKKVGLGQSAKDAARDNFEKSRLANRAKEVLDVVNAALEAAGPGAGGYLSRKDQPGSLDAHVFALLAPLVFASPGLPEDTLPQLISQSYPALVALLDRVRAQLWPEPTDSETWPAWATAQDLASTPLLSSSPSDATVSSSSWWPFKHREKASPNTAGTHPSTTQSRTAQSQNPRSTSKSPLSREEKRLRWGRAIWACTALLGLVGYTFASGIPPTSGSVVDPSTSCVAGLGGGSGLLMRPATRTAAAGVGEECPRRHRLVSGTFNSADLFVLSYDELGEQLSIEHTVPGEGPHQYLAYGVSTTGSKTVYATTWGQPAALSSWHFDPRDGGLTFGNRKLITATGSYVHVQPPPFQSETAPGFGSLPGPAVWLGSAGGPTGELHRLDPVTGQIGDKTTELVFLPNPEDLGTADKTRKALRYGAHSFDCSSNTLPLSSLPGREREAGANAGAAGTAQQIAFVADLGSNSIKAYSFPDMQYLYEVASARDGDGPRHSIPHPTLPLLFSVTEHTNFVDVYQQLQAQVRFLATADMLNAEEAADRHSWRGDTLRLSSDTRYLFASTRGKTELQKGLVVAYQLLVSDDQEAGLSVQLKQVARFQTRTSGGKANAIELAPHYSPSPPDLLVLTDDEQGYIDILEWNPTTHEFTVKATTQLPLLPGNGGFQGASHAIWLD
ncbi:putative isomerase YbhE [Testicularia cyperi]|uniref:Putative isomerase YbhE n=1 Tax=Testicularia cyperi TaxID=1882483 RepID=A0A317XXW2_9BASI|nr:putative isomerase YbhE [Testicularia cyperi]